jgi:hypothetical protein
VKRLVDVSDPMPRNFNEASFCAGLALLEGRTSKSFLIAVTTQTDAPGQLSEWSPSASLDRFTKCSLALWRGWSGQVQESLKLVNRSSVLISFLISARVLGWAKRKAISQMTL